MKLIWEIDDVVPGLKIKTKSCDEVYLLGYKTIWKNNDAYVEWNLVSLFDGKINSFEQLKELVDYLTYEGFYPELWLTLSKSD